MQFRSLNAVFGKLDHHTLDLLPGLNVIEAPNESGKSTLAAFLRVMLYGLSTRERGALADKNLYSPWSGSPMQGRLELLLDNGRSVTLTRDTARANAPMGRFSAVYTGTGEAASDLTAADCGETLLGVPREVYERSAFIRQSGLAVDANAELERRIAALITTGEEGCSYSEAEAVLRKQLNARRHNKTGRIPALDEQIDAAERSLAELHQLLETHRAAQEALCAADAQAAQIRTALKQHELADAQETQQTVLRAKYDWQNAASRAELFRRAMTEDHIPPRAELEQAHARLLTLDSLRADVIQAEQQSSDAQSALASAPSGAAKKSLPWYLASLLSLAASAALASPLFCAPLGQMQYPLALLFLVLCVAFLSKARGLHRRRHAYRAAHTQLEHAAQEAAAAADAKKTIYQSAEYELLSLLPIETLAQAAPYIKKCFARHDELDALLREAQRAQMRYETRTEQQDTPSFPIEPIARPSTSRDALREQLADCERRAREAQRQIDFTAGRCRAIGDAADLESALAALQAERASAQAEYDAIALAMGALANANTALQSRFSPALSRRAAELFRRMTDGKYSAVLLDRSFHAAAEETGAAVAHSASSLSQGAADQLYLAVRLAICEMVLPDDRSVPLVLDDALTSFDDTRCAAALELLLEESRHRQILLLTCQHREAQYLAGREGVYVTAL